jgi:hypothetical protein
VVAGRAAARISGQFRLALAKAEPSPSFPHAAATAPTILPASASVGGIAAAAIGHATSGATIRFPSTGLSGGTARSKLFAHFGCASDGVADFSLGDAPHNGGDRPAARQKSSFSLVAWSADTNKEEEQTNCQSLILVGEH